MQSLVSSFGDFWAFILRTPFFLSCYFVGLTLAPTCRSDGGSSEPRWHWPLPGDCTGAAGGCSGPGPVQRSGRPALPGPVLLHRDYCGLSRPRAPQRAQEHTPQRRETVSTEWRKDQQRSFAFMSAQQTKNHFTSKISGV